MVFKFNRACTFLVVFLLFFIPKLLLSQTNQEIARMGLQSTVSIVIMDSNENLTSRGSGFFIEADKVLTNYHVIEDASSGFIIITGQDSSYAIVGVLGFDKNKDIALLKVEYESQSLLQLGDSDSTEIGDEVFAIGSPVGLEGTFSNGIVSSKRSFDDQEHLQITAPISPGSSGGPILNFKGEVVGLAVGSIVEGQNLNFAVPINQAKELLSQEGEILAFSPFQGQFDELWRDSSNRNNFTCGSLISDEDGYTYETVLIGEQCWMAQNLRTSTYSNGISIMNLQNDSMWSHSRKIPGWSFFDHDDKYDAIYGKLYNWYAVNNEDGICPINWRVPSDYDWIELEMFLGLSESEKTVVSTLDKVRGESNNVGGKLKAVGTKFWHVINKGATNESGFAGLPGGYRRSNGEFVTQGGSAMWWSSTELNGSEALNRGLGFLDTGIFRDAWNKYHGMSVRCIIE